MSRSTKQASPYKKGQVEELDHDFLVSFLEVDPEVKAAILGYDSSSSLHLDVTMPDERVQVLRSVEDAGDDDIVALTGLYAEIDSWSHWDAPAPKAPEPAPRRNRTPSNRSASVTAVKVSAEPTARPARKAPAAKSTPTPKAKAPASANRTPVPRVSVVKPAAPARERAAAAAVRTVEIIRAPEPVRPLHVVEENKVVILQAAPRFEPAPTYAPAAVVEVMPLPNTPERPVSFGTLAAQYDVIHRETLSLPAAPTKRERRKGTKDLAFIAAQAQEGYNTWLATRSRYAMQWDYMNFNLAPPPPPPRTLREARRIETRTMIKYYRINAYKAHDRQDKKAARQMLAHARSGRLQSA